MHQDDIQYGEASLKARESFASQVKVDLNKNLSPNSVTFLRLVAEIPNWETYLTTKQLESAKKYISLLNASEVDYQLRLNTGTTQQRLFGNKTSKGALGRLQSVYNSLQENGYYEKKKQQLENSAKKKKVRLSDKTVQSVRELITLIVDNPDYERYLTKSQADKVYHFIRLRNFKTTAKHCGITEDALKRVLLGQNGVLEKLKEETNKKTVSSWDEI